MKITERKIDYGAWKEKEYRRLLKEGLKPESMYFVENPDIFWEYKLFMHNKHGDEQAIAFITFDDVLTKAKGLLQQRLEALEYFKVALGKAVWDRPTTKTTKELVDEMQVPR